VLGALLKEAGSFLLGALVSHTAVTTGMLPIANGSEIGKKVRGCYEKFVGLFQSLSIFCYNIYCPLYCSCAAPETSCLNNLLVVGQDRTCSAVLLGSQYIPGQRSTDTVRQSSGFLC